MRIDPAHIRRIAQEIRDLLGDDFDSETYLDTLDGETNALDAIGYLIQQREEAKAHAEACKQLEATYKARATRLTAKATAMTEAMGAVLDAIGERKVAHPLGTVSRTKGRTIAVITDEEAIPSQLCKVVRSPDKAAIKEQLEAGEDVPGATLETSPDGISVRVK